MSPLMSLRLQARPRPTRGGRLLRRAPLADTARHDPSILQVTFGIRKIPLGQRAEAVRLADPSTGLRLLVWARCPPPPDERYDGNQHSERGSENARVHQGRDAFRNHASLLFWIHRGAVHACSTE